jgi:glycerol kinase
MSAVLAIDQGTTGSTALVFSHEGEILGRAYHEFTQYYPQPGWVEHDPEEIWQVSRNVMAAALAASGIGPGELSAIGITNQRETTVVWDRGTGQPVHRAIVWQSRQSAGICERLKAGGLEPLIREKTGLVIDPYFSGTKIRWILDRDPELQHRAEAGELAFGTIDSWLLWKMTGGKAQAGALHRTDPTNASRTLLYDIHEQAWDEKLCQAIDVPMSMLPEVHPSAGIFGETGHIECVPVGVPIAGIAGDQQAALYGQGCWEAGQAKNTYGTGCFLLMNMGLQHPVSQNGLLTTVCCDAYGAPAYALEGSIFIAGAAIQWLRDELHIIKDASETDALAREIAGNEGVYLVPAFAGLGAPYWDMGARGAILGLTRGAGRAHLARAALEAIAYQSRDIVEVMNLDSGVELKELRVDGGASKNDFLLQFQADILGVPVDRPKLVETTAAGSAYLAGLAVGVWNSPSELDHVRRTDCRFEPQMEDRQRQELYRGWHDAVARVRSNQGVNEND